MGQRPRPGQSACGGAIQHGSYHSRRLANKLLRAQAGSANGGPLLPSRPPARSWKPHPVGLVLCSEELQLRRALFLGGVFASNGTVPPAAAPVPFPRHPPAALRLQRTWTTTACRWRWTRCSSGCGRSRPVTNRRWRCWGGRFDSCSSNWRASSSARRPPNPTSTTRTISWVYVPSTFSMLTVGPHCGSLTFSLIEFMDLKP